MHSAAFRLALQWLAISILPRFAYLIKVLAAQISDTSGLNCVTPLAVLVQHTS
jgi:hypothetical protein